MAVTYQLLALFPHIILTVEFAITFMSPCILVICWPGDTILKLDIIRYEGICKHDLQFINLPGLMWKNTPGLPLYLCSRELTQVYI
ncbi:hypothetical protein EDD17DRAFT_1546939 [Pisolithus thermaeus]|nr:hypothetical protein EDD17DRAFT_1546939 [Pisolithus thermaeus]